MRKVSVLAVAILLTSFSPGVFAEEGGFASYFSGTLTGTSDYVFRGISNSDETWAVQGSFDFAHPVGVYAGIWGSNSAFAQDAGGQIEADYYVGFANEVVGIGYDVTLLYYTFPRANDDPEFDYFEGHLGLSYGMAFGPVEPSVGVGYNYSPDFFGEDGNAHYVNGTLDIGLPLGFGLGAEVGYQTVEGDKSTGNGAGMDGGDGFDYVHWRVSGSYAIAGFSLDLSYHHTDSDAEEFFGDIAGPRWVLTVSRSL